MLNDHWLFDLRIIIQKCPRLLLIQLNLFELKFKRLQSNDQRSHLNMIRTQYQLSSNGMYVFLPKNQIYPKMNLMQLFSGKKRRTSDSTTSTSNYRWVRCYHPCHILNNLWKWFAYVYDDVAKTIFSSKLNSHSLI